MHWCSSSCTPPPICIPLADAAKAEVPNITHRRLVEVYDLLLKLGHPAEEVGGGGLRRIDPQFADTLVLSSARTCLRAPGQSSRRTAQSRMLRLKPRK